jgi:hypothetical protein
VTEQSHAGDPDAEPDAVLHPEFDSEPDPDVELDLDLLAIAQERYRFLISVLLAVLLVPAVLMLFLTGFVYAQTGDARYLLIPLGLALVVVPVGIVVRLQRRGHPRFPGPIRLGGADRATRRRILAAVQRAQLPATEPDRGLALELAHALVRTRWALRVIPAFVLITLPGLFLPHSPVVRALLLGLDIVVAVPWLPHWRLVRQAEAALRAA